MELHFYENLNLLEWVFLIHSFGLLIFTGIILVNLFYVKSLAEWKHITHQPFVSVLIPARNEALNIGNVLKRLENQTYAHFEVIILNDHSTDETEQVIAPFLKRNPQWKMYQGKSLPADWRGKSFACYQLGQAAQGEILLFADADTLPEPEAIHATVSALEKYDFISVFPEQIVKTWAEKLIVPVMDFFLYSHLLFPLISQTKNPAFTAANGQWMAFRKNAYQKISGYEVAKSAVLDDMTIAKAIKKAGLQMNTFSGVNAISCRMYQNPQQVIEGFSKNSFAAANYQYIGFSLFLLQFLFWFVFPFFVPVSVFGVSIFWILFLKFLIARKFQHPVWETVLLHPVAMLFAFGICINSMYWHWAGKGHWKGRKL